MANIIHTPKDIFEQEFKTSMRGYDKREVDEFLDDVIKDYESYDDEIVALHKEIATLKSQLNDAKKGGAQSSPASSAVPPVTPAGGAFAGAKTYGGAESTPVATSTVAQPVTPAPSNSTNYDILKRISRLEKEVFGKQISE
ncbi:cell division regulator GpsB [Streptococcus sp. DD12]|uniref:cell division regulator GpsB n=1 Tax=Streptococcus sp. DD12 TaxID=1777880 RepID=UPI0008348C52|nr:cell division regulator GpsB [Streptococcus sp. DD12]